MRTLPHTDRPTGRLYLGSADEQAALSPLLSQSNPNIPNPWTASQVSRTGERGSELGRSKTFWVRLVTNSGLVIFWAEGGWEEKTSFSCSLPSSGITSSSRAPRQRIVELRDRGVPSPPSLSCVDWHTNSTIHPVCFIRDSVNFALGVSLNYFRKLPSSVPYFVS